MAVKIEEFWTPQNKFWHRHGADGERPLEDVPSMVAGCFLFEDGAVDSRASEWGPVNERMFHEPPEDPERNLHMRLVYQREKVARAERAFEGQTQSLLDRENNNLGETTEEDFESLKLQRKGVRALRKTLDKLEADFSENFSVPGITPDEEAAAERAEMKVRAARDKRKNKIYALDI